MESRTLRLVTVPTLARAIGFFNIYQQSWRLIERGKTLMHCRNAIFAYHNEFSEYIKVEKVTSENSFDYLFNVKPRKFLSEKGKEYLLELFEKWDPEHLRLDEDFDDYPDNDRLEK